MKFQSLKTTNIILKMHDQNRVKNLEKSRTRTQRNLRILAVVRTTAARVDVDKAEVDSLHNDAKVMDATEVEPLAVREDVGHQASVLVANKAAPLRVDEITAVDRRNGPLPVILEHQTGERGERETLRALPNTLHFDVRAKDIEGMVCLQSN